MTEKVKRAKRFLSEAYWADAGINSKLRQVERLRSMTTRITQNFSGATVVTHTPNPKRMEDTILKIVSLEQSIDTDIDRLVELRSTAKSIISAVQDPLDRLVLELRYESFCSWTEIGAVTPISRGKLFERHNKAMEVVYDELVRRGIVRDEEAT